MLKGISPGGFLSCFITFVNNSADKWKLRVSKTVTAVFIEPRHQSTHLNGQDHEYVLPQCSSSLKTRPGLKLIVKYYFNLPFFPHIHYGYQKPFCFTPFLFTRQERNQSFSFDCNILIIINNDSVLCTHTMAESSCWNDLLRSSVLNHFPNRISSAYAGVMSGTFPVLFNTFLYFY